MSLEVSNLILEATEAEYEALVVANGREMTIDKTLTVQHGYQGLPGARNMGHGVDVFVRGAR